MENRKKNFLFQNSKSTVRFNYHQQAVTRTRKKRKDWPISSSSSLEKISDSEATVMFVFNYDDDDDISTYHPMEHN